MQITKFGKILKEMVFIGNILNQNIDNLQMLLYF